MQRGRGGKKQDTLHLSQHPICKTVSSQKKILHQQNATCYIQQFRLLGPLHGVTQKLCGSSASLCLHHPRNAAPRPSHLLMGNQHIGGLQNSPYIVLLLKWEIKHGECPQTWKGHHLAQKRSSVAGGWSQGDVTSPEPTGQVMAWSGQPPTSSRWPGRAEMGCGQHAAPQICGMEVRAHPELKKRKAARLASGMVPCHHGRANGGEILGDKSPFW